MLSEHCYIRFGKERFWLSPSRSVLRRLANPVTRYRCALGALSLLLIVNLITWATLNAPQSVTTVPATVLTPAVVAPALATAFNPDATDKIIAIAELAQPEAKINWTAWIALAWMFGALLMLFRASIKVAGAEGLRRSCRPLEDERISLLVAEACRAVQLTRKIRVAVTDKLTSPAVVGVIVPTLILPLSLFTTLTPTQIQFVLLHELAHIRRGDYLANLFQLFAEALLFFNPAVWWISHQIRREREACCDALAIELSGAPADYARTLVRVAENILQPAPTAAPAFGDDGRESSSLADRVQRLLVPGYRPALRLTWRAMLAAMCISGTLLLLSAMGARNVVGAVASNVIEAASKPATNVLETINRTADAENGSFTQPKWEHSWSSRFEKQKTSSGGTVMMFFPPREELFAVLEQIKFERVFIQNIKLSEVLAELDKALLATDPTKIGFRLLMPPDWDYPAKRDGIESVVINMPAELRDTTMRNLLELIVSNASRPIRYNFGANSASFEMKCDVPTNMWFERFKVDRKTFLPFIGVDDSTAEFDLKTMTSPTRQTRLVMPSRSAFFKLAWTCDHRTTCYIKSARAFCTFMRRKRILK
ncbi:MAG: M56 family metallopeptidase [Verrucomicrobiota bacterium]